jgi:hypothetical protein
MHRSKVRASFNHLDGGLLEEPRHKCDREGLTKRREAQPQAITRRPLTHPRNRGKQDPARRLCCRSTSRPAAGPASKRSLKAIRAMPATRATGMATPVSSSPNNNCPTSEGTNGSRARRSPGRPRIKRAVEQLIVRMAEENRDWGYDRISESEGESTRSGRGAVSLFMVISHAERCFRA